MVILIDVSISKYTGYTKTSLKFPSISVMAMAMAFNSKNFGRLIEGYQRTIGIGVIITIASLIAFGILLVIGFPGFSVPIIFLFIGMWIAASQWNELGKMKIVAGFVAAVTYPTRISTASNLLKMKTHTFIHCVTKLITRGVIEIDIFPEVDAFGPKGSKRPESLPKDHRPRAFTPISPYQRITTIIQWIGLIGTLIAIIYHILALFRILGTV